MADGEISNDGVNGEASSARAGGQARGGTAPRPDDPASPAQAEAIDDETALDPDRFGDHKGTGVDGRVS